MLNLAREADLSPSKRKPEAANDADLLAFMPAAIEVEATPASRAGRAIIWVIVLLFSLAVAWACFGHIDIVAVAQGKVIPNERVKFIQPLEAATVQAIHVKEGQKIVAGEPLITLDSTQAQADVTRLTQELNEAKATQQRLRLFETWLAATSDDMSDGVLGWEGTQNRITNNPSEKSEHTPSLSADNQHLLQQQISEVQSRLNSLNNEQQKLRAEQAMVQAEIRKKQRILPVLKQRVDALDTLQQKSYGSKLQFLELQQQLIEEEQDLAVQRAREQQLSATLQGVALQQNTLTSEQRLRTLDQLQQLKVQTSALQQELIKARQREQQHRLVAPINGEVQQLAVTTVGGVVTPAQVLMHIVPGESQLEVEAMILNKDIGFVAEGQPAKVKIDTFNFTKYGFITGTLANISDDAIQDEHLGLAYKATIHLDEQSLPVNGREVALSPGMAITAEVKTGTRRIIEFFLAPLLRYKQESLGER